MIPAPTNAIADRTLPALAFKAIAPLFELLLLEALPDVVEVPFSPLSSDLRLVQAVMRVELLFMASNLVWALEAFAWNSSILVWLFLVLVASLVVLPASSISFSSPLINAQVAFVLAAASTTAQVDINVVLEDMVSS